MHVGAGRADAVSAKGEIMVYFGTYTGKASLGIYVSRFDAGTGGLTLPELAVETKNPTFLALHPSGERLYAVNEVDNFNGERSGAVRSEEHTSELQTAYEV